MKYTIEIEKWADEWFTVHLIKRANLQLVKAVANIDGVEHCEMFGAYSLAIKKAKLFEWKDVEIELLNVLREESYLD